ncbi:VOC family protein [Candidatus Saccharibacteria bacterium]|nr:VOC family protein [Candidatus Saccharibacteria bacterium]
MNMKLELVSIPVSDVDKSKSFYANTLGFHVDHDVEPGNGLRVVQLTPPGSACSIVIGTGMGLNPKDGIVRNTHLVVEDINVMHDQLANRGLSISDINDMGGGVKYAYFADPDGNTWALQEINQSARQEFAGPDL